MTRRTVPSARELFGPAGTPRVVVVGAGFGGIAAGVKMKRAGIHTFTIYESSLGHRRHVVGQHVPGRRGRRRLAPLLVLVQVARLDPHPRASRRSCRSTSRRRSTSSGCARTSARRRRAVGARGTTTGTCGRSRSTTADRRVPRVHQRRRLPQRAALPRLARPRRLRRAQVPHLAVGAPPRPHRQDGRGRGHRLDRDAARARHPARGRAPLPVPAGAGLGHAQGRPRLHRRRAHDGSPTRGAAGRSAFG